MTIAVAPRTLKAAFITEPLRIAADQPHQTLISAVSVSLTAHFFVVDGVVNTFVAYAAAIGVEYAYLKGLSDASYTKSAWGSRLIWTAFAILAIAGTYVLMRDVYHAESLKQPSGIGAFVLSLLHIIPLAFLGLCSAKLHAEAEALRLDQIRTQHDEQATLERQRIAAERQREQEQRAFEDEQRRLRSQRAAELEDERARRLMDIETKVHARKVFTEIQSVNTREHSDTVNTSVFGASESEIDKWATIRADIAKTLREHSVNSQKVNKAALAKRLGISRGKLYDLIREIEQAGEL